MAAILTPPVPELEIPSDNGRRDGGGAFDPPDDESQGNSEPKPKHPAFPFSAYRVAMWVVIVWIAALFIALSCIATSLRHSKDWTGISLPFTLYMNTAILILSNLSVEFARAHRVARHCARWLFVTVLLGLGFVGGQILMWNKMESQGLHFVSSATSFCVYLMSGTHMLFLLGGIAAIVYAISAIRGVAGIEKRQTAADIAAIYWHFISAVWLYVLTLLVTLGLRFEGYGF